MHCKCGSSTRRGSPIGSQAHIELDLRGLKCPLPVLRTRKALRRLRPGETIVVYCTDPLASIDIPHLVRSEGHRLEAQSVESGIMMFRIAVSESGPER